MSNKPTRFQRLFLNDDQLQKLYTPEPEVKNLAADSHRLLQFLTGAEAIWFDAKNYHQLTKEGYIKNIVAGRCINIISNGIGSLRWVIRDKSGEEVTEGELFDLLTRPSPTMGAQSFFSTLEMHKLISGNAYIRSVRVNDRRPPSELQILRPDRMRVEPGKYNIPRYYEYQRTKGDAMVFDVDPVTGDSEVLHIYFPNPIDDWQGLSPIRRAAVEIAQHNEGSEWNKKLLQNGARPSGALTTEQELTEDSRNFIRQEMEQQYQGAANAGRPLVLEGGLDWKEIQMSPKDVDFLNGRKQSAMDIANAFGVPGQLIGLQEAQTYNNVREAKLAVWEETILPEADCLCTELNHWLMPMFGDEYTLEYDQDEIVALEPRREERWKKIQDATFLTVNEKRELLGFEPMDGGDVLSVPTVGLTAEGSDEPEEEVEDQEPTEDVSEERSAAVEETKDIIDDNPDDWELVAVVPEDSKATIVQVGDAEGHDHSIDVEVKNGVTSEDVDHTHEYTIGAKYTGIADGHRHLMPTLET